MVEIGHVRTIKNEYASITFKRKSGCGDNCAHCGSDCSGSNSIVDIKNTLNASIGDLVEIHLKTSSFFKMNLWTYGFPLLMLLVGLVVGDGYSAKLGFKNHEIFSAFTALAFITLAFFILGVIDKKISKNIKYNLCMVRIIEKATNHS